MAIDLCCCSCGGQLDIKKVKNNIIKCEYCGKEQIVPSLDNELRIKSYTRATNFRLKKQFDEAKSIYESMLLQYPNDFEVRWGLCLCKYGVEYISDFNGKKIPICHRNLYQSILDDEDYLFAVENCDGVSKEIITEDAKYINSVQNKYIEISKSEKPYDIFISYKETENGSKTRTKDSLIAEEIYDALVKENYKVFFSRISLEDKLGQDYEPIIEFALSSAKVMILVSTSVDNINSAWVKSEWSRYLNFMRKDKGEKILIPCYLNFDPYDLPNELSCFQAKDLSKIGAIKDIVKGVKKIVNPPENNDTITLSDVISTLNKNSTGGETALKFLRRAEIYFERGDYVEAKKLLDKCLDNDPENAQAYLLLALISYGVKSLSELDEYTPEVDYVKILSQQIYYEVELYEPKENDPENTLPYNPYTPFKDEKDKGEFFIKEFEMLNDEYADYVGTLLIDENKAIELFKFETIDNNKDFKSALKYADPKNKADLERHLAKHFETRDNFVKNNYVGYNEFIRKRFKDLKEYYLEFQYNKSSKLENKNSIMSFLFIGDYKDAHEKAINVAERIIEYHYDDFELYNFINTIFNGDDKTKLNELYHKKVESEKIEFINKIDEIILESRRNRTVKFSVEKKCERSEKLKALKSTKPYTNQIYNFATRFHFHSSQCDDYLNKIVKEINDKIEKAEKEINLEDEFYKQLIRRNRGMHIATPIIFSIFIFISLIVTFGSFFIYGSIANRKNLKDSISSSIVPLFISLCVIFAVCVIAFCIIKKEIFKKMEKKYKFMLLISPPVLSGALIILSYKLRNVYGAYPILTSYFYRFLILFLIVGIPTHILIFLEFYRHDFEPIGKPFFKMLKIICIVAAVTVVVLFVFLCITCDPAKIDKENYLNIYATVNK